MTQRELFLWALKGDEPAVEFIETLGTISQVWDDLVDGDTVSGEMVSKAFMLALVTLPENLFYQAYRERLTPVMESAILDWMTATAIERQGRAAAQLAYVLRDSLAGVVVYCASLLGGTEWAMEVAPKVRGEIHDEPFEDYVAGLTHELH